MTTMANTTTMPLSNKPNPQHKAGNGKKLGKTPAWQKMAQNSKEDYEKAEPIKDIHGNTSELRINTETHSKIVVSNETIKQLMNYARKGDEYTVLQSSFDEIIQSLLKRQQKKKHQQ